MSNHVENVRKHTAQAAVENRRGVPYYEMKDSSRTPTANTIRFLPPFPGEDMYYRETTVAYRVGPGQKFIVPGPQVEDHPYWSYIAQLRASKSAPDKQILRQIGPVVQYMAWVLDRADMDSGPKLLSMNFNSLQRFNSYMVDSQVGDFTDPVTGRDFTINYTPRNKSANTPAKWNDVRISLGVSALGVDFSTIGNLWEKYKLGNAMEADYIQAVMDGTEKEFLQSRKDSQNDGTAPWDNLHGVPLVYEYPAGLMASSKMWIVVDGKPVETSALQVVEDLFFGTDHLCTDGQKQWSKASTWGFKKVQDIPVVPELPPLPPSAPALPPLPPQASGVPGPVADEAVLTAQLNALANKKPQETSTVDQLEALLNS